MAAGRKANEKGRDPLLALAVHEFKNVLTPLSGYLRMLLKDETLSKMHHHLVSEAMKSVGRVASLTEELRDLSNLEGGGAVFEKKPISLPGLLAREVAIAIAPDDRSIGVKFDNQAGGATVHADETRLAAALGSLLFALRRELITSTDFHVRLRVVPPGNPTRQTAPALRISMAGSDRIEEVDAAGEDKFQPFDEYKFGSIGLRVPIATRILQAHHVQVWAVPPVEAEPADPARHESGSASPAPPLKRERAGAVLLMPHASAP